MISILRLILYQINIEDLKTTFIAINKNRNDFEKIIFKNILENFFTKNLPRTISGKISKVDLRNNLKE